MIIDGHAHMGFSPFTGEEVGVEDVLRDCDHYGIDRCCIVSFKAIYYEFREGNREHLEACRKAPQRLVPVAFFDPGWGPTTVEAVREAAEMGHKAVKMRLQPGDSYRLRNIVLPALEVVEEKGLPVFVECSNSTQDLFPFAERFAQVPFLVLLEHVASRELYAPAFELPNVHLVIDSCLDIPDAVGWGAEWLGDERLIFGTRYPERDPAWTLGRVLESALSEPQRERILGGNLLRLLGLKP